MSPRQCATSPDPLNANAPAGAQNTITPPTNFRRARGRRPWAAPATRQHLMQPHTTQEKAAGPAFVTPSQKQWEEMLNCLNAARNKLDALTFEAPQEYRRALYPLIDCIEAWEAVGLTSLHP